MRTLKRLLAIGLVFVGLSACSRDDTADSAMTDENVSTTDVSGMNASDVNNDIASQAGHDLPEFKIPAPRASAQMVLPRSLLPTGTLSLAQVGDALRSRLSDAGYGELGYYRVTNGFALATRMERINPDGRPFQGAKRWMTEATGLASFSGPLSLASMMRSLLNADPGSYRVLVFVVTNRPVTNSAANMESDVAETMVVDGASDLPEAFSEAGFRPDYRVTALIYEFSRTAVGKPAKFSRPSSRTAAEQLRLANILRA